MLTCSQLKENKRMLEIIDTSFTYAIHFFLSLYSKLAETLLALLSLLSCILCVIKIYVDNIDNNYHEIAIACDNIIYCD